MTENFLGQLFSENGIIIGLFVVSFLGFIYKAIPYGIKKFDEQTLLFREALREQALAYKEDRDKQNLVFTESLDKIATTFLDSVENSKRWHESHDKKLEEIREIVKKGHQKS